MIHAHQHERDLSELGYPVCHDEEITFDDVFCLGDGMLRDYRRMEKWWMNCLIERREKP